MNINFNDVTYEKIKFLASREGISVAAYVSNTMDRIAREMVSMELTFTAEEDSPAILPEPICMTRYGESAPYYGRLPNSKGLLE